MQDILWNGGLTTRSHTRDLPKNSQRATHDSTSSDSDRFKLLLPIKIFLGYPSGGWLRVGQGCFCIWHRNCIQVDLKINTWKNTVRFKTWIGVLTTLNGQILLSNNNNNLLFIHTLYNFTNSQRYESCHLYKQWKIDISGRLWVGCLLWCYTWMAASDKWPFIL